MIIFKTKLTEPTVKKAYHTKRHKECPLVEVKSKILYCEENIDY